MNIRDNHVYMGVYGCICVVVLYQDLCCCVVSYVSYCIILEGHCVARSRPQWCRSSIGCTFTNNGASTYPTSGDSGYLHPAIIHITNQRRKNTDIRTLGSGVGLCWQLPRCPWSVVVVCCIVLCGAC